MIGRLAIGVATALALSGAASAKDLELDYEAVMHVRSSDSIGVLDNEAHRVGFAAFRGLAVFAEEGVTVHRYEGWFDLVNGSGPFHGYALFTFADGSTLRAAYNGTAEAIEQDGVRVEAAFTEFSGGGRFEAVSGTGSFAGRRYDAIDQGGSTYVQGTLSLTVPD